MHMVGQDLCLAVLVFHIPLGILIQNDVPGLISLLLILVALIKNLQGLRQWLRVIDDEWLPVDIRWWHLLCDILSMLIGFNGSIFQELLLLLLIIELAVDRIIVMSFPILLINLVSFLINFLLYLLLVILFVLSRHDIVLPLLFVQEICVSFDWELDLSLFKEIVREFLVIDDIVGVADGA